MRPVRHSPRMIPAILVAIGLGIVGMAAAADGGPDPRIKELRILDQLAGSWTGTQPGTKRRVQTTSEWILEGRVLQTKSLLTDGREMLILRTYDPGLRKYIVSIWDSRGMAIILSGDWDPQEKMLTVSTEAGRLRVTAVSRLVDPDTEEWQVQFTDSAGKPQRQFGGTNHRDKP